MTTLSQIHDEALASEENLKKYTEVFKMANFGNMLNGALHTFNNILCGILGYSQLMKYELPGDSDALRQAQVIESAARRASRLISQLQHFTKRDSYRKITANPSTIIEQAANILHNALHKNITIELELEHGDNNVVVDPSSLYHVLLNLAFNAADSMLEGGNLFISTIVVTHGDLQALQENRKYLQIRVRDTGEGISKKNITRIFDPFFTTRSEVAASGMGLTITKSIVEDQGGSISVESKLNGGTTFTVSLPAINHNVQPTMETKAESTLTSRTGNQLIMVVDDEDDLRFMTKRILEKNGYRVLLADSGTTAIELYEEHSDEIGLVILDMIMPGVDGSQVYEKIKLIRSDSKVILTSGYLNTPPFQRILDAGEAPFIQKPWDLTKLLEATKQTLASEGCY